MPLMTKLAQYLDMEAKMLALDVIDDLAADAIRDELDPIWYSLTDEDRAILNAREPD